MAATTTTMTTARVTAPGFASAREPLSSMVDTDITGADTTRIAARSSTTIATADIGSEPNAMIEADEAKVSSSSEHHGGL